MSGSDSYQKIQKSLQIIEQQLAIIHQIIGASPSDDDGVVGIFDGEFMVSEDGKKYQIPPNYASKSMLVVGDKVKMVEDLNGGQAKFKQIDKVERVKLEGVLARKDGKYEVLTDIGSFKVLPVAVKHYNGDSGDRVKIQIPKNYTKGGWAAFEKVVADQAGEIAGMPQVLLTSIDSMGESASSRQEVSSSGASDSASQANHRAGGESASSNDNSPSKKSKSRKRKKKSGGGGESANVNRNTDRAPEVAKPTPPVTESLPDKPALVEVSFDDDDLV